MRIRQVGSAPPPPRSLSCPGPRPLSKAAPFTRPSWPPASSSTTKCVGSLRPPPRRRPPRPSPPPQPRACQIMLVTSSTTLQTLVPCVNRHPTTWRATSVRPCPHPRRSRPRRRRALQGRHGRRRLAGEPELVDALLVHLAGGSLRTSTRSGSEHGLTSG